MPEDYQGQSATSLPEDAAMANLLKGLGVDLPEAGGEGAGATPDTTPVNDGNNPTQDPAGTGDAAPAGDAQPAAPASQQEDPAASIQAQRANQAFAEMRTKNASYEKFIDHLMRASNYTGSRDDYMKVMTDIAYAQLTKIQGQGTDPKVLKRLDELENQNKILSEQNNRTLFASNLKNLQEHFKLTANDLKSFVDTAVKEGIDLTAPGTNFIALYQGINHDKLVAEAIEAERQKWLAKQAQGQTTSTTPDGKSGKTDPAKTDVNTMAEFNSLLNNLK